MPYEASLGIRTVTLPLVSSISKLELANLFVGRARTITLICYFGIENLNFVTY